MNGDGAFLQSSGLSDGACLSVEVRGKLAIRAHFRAAHLYSVGWLRPDHDAVMRIGGEAPGGGANLQYGIRATSNHGFPPLGSSIRQCAESQRERRIAP